MISFKEFINEVLKKVDGRWALVSKINGKPLQYWDHKPSEDEVNKVERRIQYFKHMRKKK